MGTLTTSNLNSAASEMTLSAKDFEQPLREVLASLNAQESPVDWREVYPVVFKRMGIAVDAYGINAPTQTPWTIKWIQWAYRNLVSQGLAPTSKGRGFWGLTKEGVPPMSTPVIVTPIASSTLDAATATAYCSSLPCFKSYNACSTVCHVCPVRVDCINAQSGLFSEIARALPTTASAEKDKKRRAKRQPTILSSEKVTANLDTICANCQGTIKKGEPAMWVNGGASTQNLVHLACFESEIKGV